MSWNLNRVTLSGRAGAVPEQGPNKKTVRFDLATVQAWKDRATGERHEHVEWHKIVVFNDQLASIALNHVTKGMRIYLQGTLRGRRYTDSEGVSRWVTEVILGVHKAALELIDSRVNRDLASAGLHVEEPMPAMEAAP